MPDHDILAVGASAGGVEALGRLARALPQELPAAVFVVLHVPPNATSALPDILRRKARLQAAHATHGEPIRTGRIYVAPPDRHLVVAQGNVRLSRGPRENGHRPAIDPTFRSVAREYGARVVGVVLSGALEDGTAGLEAIKAQGGITVVQDPSDALYPGMPSNAISHIEVDHVLSATAIGVLVAELAMAPPGSPPGPDDALRCQVGSPESVLGQPHEALERALWIALRSLKERATLARRLAASARERGYTISAMRFDEQAVEAEAAATQVHRLLLERGDDLVSWQGDRDGAATVPPPLGAASP